MSSAPTQLGMYVAKWPDGKFVAISAADAGYPTAINSIEGAATWPTAKAAAEYLQVGADVAAPPDLADFGPCEPHVELV